MPFAPESTSTALWSPVPGAITCRSARAAETTTNAHTTQPSTIPINRIPLLLSPPSTPSRAEARSQAHGNRAPPAACGASRRLRARSPHHCSLRAVTRPLGEAKNCRCAPVTCTRLDRRTVAHFLMSVTSSGGECDARSTRTPLCLRDRDRAAGRRGRQRAGQPHHADGHHVRREPRRLRRAGHAYVLLLPERRPAR